jgi:ubiquinone/menaquinone biosynthesis C-methylase UbiE
MQLRKPNKNWPKEMQQLYEGKFMDDIQNARFTVPNNTFSNPKILNCLENETHSALSEAKLVKKILGDKKINSILNIGTGSGRLSTQIQKIFPKTNIFEIDKNCAVIKRLQEKYKNQSCRKPMLGDACKLPLENDSIDIIICYSVFRYIENIKDSLAEFKRVIKKNGTIIISEAKDKSTIAKVKKQLNEQSIEFKANTISTVRLPHLTFFYYLVSKYDNNNLVKRMIDQERFDKGVSIEQAAYNLAGYSLGSIYTVFWNKTND